MEIEQARIEDMQEILDLQKLAYQSEAIIYNNYNIPPLIQTLEEIKNDYRNHYFLKITINHKIIGSVKGIMKEGDFFISRLIVHPNFQNQGIGTLLMKAIEEKFNFAKRYELFTGHLSYKNILLYQKLGYKEFKTEIIDEHLRMVYLQKFSLPK